MDTGWGIWWKTKTGEYSYYTKSNRDCSLNKVLGHFI